MAVNIGRTPTVVRRMTGLVVSALLVVACGGGGGSSGGPSGPGDPIEPPPDPNCENGQSFSSTFAAVQEVIFEKHGCTQELCHGSSAQGGLNLSPEVAYANLLLPSLGSSYPRITPGDRERSFLWRKLAAATFPGTVEISGTPMPNGLPPLSEDELEGVRQWIVAGAPETGTVLGTEELLSACLPDPKPIAIEPLPAPAPGTGFQITLPPWPLGAASEHEICFAAYYDISDQVPEEFQDPQQEGWFRFKGFELRQDPQSHHLILYYPAGNFAPGGIDVHDPEFGQWTCTGGETPGAVCEPTDLSSCGSGYCISEIQSPSFACIGYGPGQGLSIPVGGAQQAQAYQVFHDGVYAQLPTKGVIYFNSHAFNLTSEGTEMRGWINYLFAENQVYPVQNIFDTHLIFAPNAAPFTTQHICGDHVLPKGARLFELSSHTHKHGKHFTIDLPDGTRVYESYVYNDPVRQDFDPPLAFDSPNAADRTLRYCSLFNNGVNEDGSKNIETVTRYSRFPEPVKLGQQPGICKPVACVNEGKVGDPCNGVGDDAACDTTPGAGDGWCDACPIRGGESTENEMFNLFGAYYLE